MEGLIPDHSEIRDMQYDLRIRKELQHWQQKMLRPPSRFSSFSQRIQKKINGYIPEKVHQLITTAIKQMIRVVLFGAGVTASAARSEGSSLQTAEADIEELITKYKRTASIEGGITGAGGFLMGLADFPLLLSIKLKLLFEIATRYGFDLKDYRERIFLLHVFQLAFSSPEHRIDVYKQIANWNKISSNLPESIHDFDWRNFQQQYRDYIDLAKMAQLIPGIGAVVGVVVNYTLIQKLGVTAMNAYRMRLLNQHGQSNNN